MSTKKALLPNAPAGAPAGQHPPSGPALISDDAINNSMELYFEEKRMERARAKAAASPLNHSWFDKSTLNDGKASFSRVTSQFEKVNRILVPVMNKKKLVEELNSIRETLLARPRNRDKNESWFSWRILHYIHPPEGTLRQKRMLILWRFSVIRELKYRFQTASTAFQECRALQLMDKTHMHLAKLDPAVLRDFNQRREKYRTERAQLGKVRQAQSSCDAIFKCKSLLHYQPAGCPTCGVIFIGTSQNLAPFVKRVDRWTGVQTLVPLPFEMETLAEELKAQSEIVDNLYNDYVFLETPLRELVCRSIQAWYVFKSAKWIKERQEARRLRSMKVIRWRTLKLMKKYVDDMCEKEMDILGVNLDTYPDSTSSLRVKFSLVSKEMAEYISERARRRHESTTRLAKLMLDKLKFRVNRTRHKKYLEEQRKLEEERLFYERTQAARDAKALKLCRKRVEILESRTFRCPRPGCESRHFLSKDRYETHMSIHKYNDDIRSQRLQVVKQKYDERLSVEKSMISRIKESKANLIPFESENSNSDVTLSLENVPQSFALPSSWTGTNVINNMSDFNYNLSHERLAYDTFNRPLFHLELVSRHGNVDAPFKFALKDPIIRVGTMLGCEMFITLTGKAKAESRISKIHSIIHCFENTIIDNSSVYGTYVVCENGVHKVPSVISHPLQLCVGNLLCFGVKEDGPPTITATEASEAALVYRICSFTH